MIMAMSTIDKYKVSFDTENINVRDMVIAGLDQVQSNSTKDFNEVCDRLEKNIRMQQYTIRMSKLSEQDLESAGDYIAYKLLNPTTAVNTMQE